MLCSQEACQPFASIRSCRLINYTFGVGMLETDRRQQQLCMSPWTGRKPTSLRRCAPRRYGKRLSPNKCEIGDGDAWICRFLRIAIRFAKNRHPRASTHPTRFGVRHRCSKSLDLGVPFAGTSKSSPRQRIGSRTRREPTSPCRNSPKRYGMLLLNGTC
jgi:hypothetical protein